MIRGRDQNRQIAFFEAFADKATNDAAQGFGILVELHTMKLTGNSSWSRWRLSGEVIGFFRWFPRNTAGSDLLHDVRQGNLLEMQW